MLKANGTYDNVKRHQSEDEQLTNLTVLHDFAGSSRVADRNGTDDRTWTWLSRELHDGVTQQLWFLHTELNSLVERLQDHEPELAADARKLTEVAGDAYQELRTTLKLLSAWGSCDVRFAAELRGQVEKFSKTTGLKVELSGEQSCSDFQIPGGLAREIIRLVQEALWNCVKHSRCEQAKVSLRVTDGGMFVTISDSGRGFEFEEIDSDRYGISSMRDRAKSINGRLYVTSGRGKGTKVTLFVPLEEIGANG